MDHIALQTFLTVAQQGSFTEAAEKLYVSQSAVSKRIAALENELSSQLLDRIGKKVFLTEAGKVLASRAQTLLMEMEDTRRQIHNLSNKVSGRLSLGTSHHVGLHRLPGVLLAFTGQYPDVELDLQFMNSEGVCDAVQRGVLELGVITLPLQPMEHLSTQPVWHDELEFVIGRSHPLVNARLTELKKGQQLPCQLRELAEHSAILPSRGTYTREIIEGVFSRRNLALHTSMQPDYLETIKMLVSVGLGWSVLPRTMLNDEAVLIVKVPKVHICRTLGAVYHASRTLSNAARQMLAQLTPDANDTFKTK